MTKRRNMQGIAHQAVSFGDVDPHPFAPLHRRLGIVTFVHHQATTDYHGGLDRQTGEYWSPHCYRDSVTLARIA